MWTAIGNLGDAALTLPLAAVCFAWLTRSLYGWRIALSWATLLAAAMLLVGVTKILHAGCGVQIRAVHFRAISGHALLAAAVWPMACLLMLHDGWNTRTLRALLPGLALAATIAVARARDDAHTASEVMAGWMLGVLVTVVLLKRWTDAPILPPVLRPLAVVSVCAVAALAYGRHAAIQDAIDVYAPVVCARGM
ncbi:MULTISPECIES: phosphatase PAP2 family protein [Burkholderia cepacia complex]|uniref:Phosphatase PAP2 family protein n=2 Tax=Burkholderia cepacia complex TaxID=87882 RepID=A0ABS1AVJ5_BURVI|nr:MULTISPECIES: phosphatase PAP2 family protein [Burkholderia cepacia complex]AOJ77179.1 phosphoesterase [Burkholderia ubonensis]AOK02753.1 phosphoesterase [Burkholderia vietnamiensis]AOK14280.1 phosphoesterase [Burkholderia vietnamiensis]AOK45191.1 phosphoesterase [Burkholderia vietnamiensis]KVE03189.1 phosphoesterase [Burkholderia vietnamiensis]